MSKYSKRVGASGFMAENLLVLGILVILLGIAFGLYIRTYGVPWLFVVVLLAVGVSLVGLAWRARRRGRKPGNGSR